MNLKELGFKFLWKGLKLGFLGFNIPEGIKQSFML